MVPVAKERQSVDMVPVEMAEQYRTSKRPFAEDPACVRQAGAIVARTFTEFQDLFLLAENINNKNIRGNRLAAVSGAGFEAVGMADSIQSDDYQMQLAGYSAKTVAQLHEIMVDKRLDGLVTISNPLDINPSADDETHASVVDILARDGAIDAIVVGLDPLSPVMHTLLDTAPLRGCTTQYGACGRCY